MMPPPSHGWADVRRLRRGSGSAVGERAERVVLRAVGERTKSIHNLSALGGSTQGMRRNRITLTRIPQTTQRLSRQSHIGVVHAQHARFPPPVFAADDAAAIYVHGTPQVALWDSREGGAVEGRRDPLQVGGLGTEFDARAGGVGVGQVEAAQRGQRVGGHRGEVQRLRVMLCVGGGLWVLLCTRRTFLLHRGRVFAWCAGSGRDLGRLGKRFASDVGASVGRPGLVSVAQPTAWELESRRRSRLFGGRHGQYTLYVGAETTAASEERQPE